MFDRNIDDKVIKTAQFLMSSLKKHSSDDELRDIDFDMKYGQFDSVALEVYAKMLKGKIALSIYELVMLATLFQLLDLETEGDELRAYILNERGFGTGHLASDLA